MKYEMPALTDEQREQLTEYLLALIHGKLLTNTDITLDIQLLNTLCNKIALAALTAEVGMGVRVIQKNERLKGFDFDGYENLTAGHHHFYTAPPVPVSPEPDYQIEYRISQVTAWVSVTKETYDNATRNVKKRIVHVLEEHQ